MANRKLNPSRRDLLKVFSASTGAAIFQSPIQILIESIILGAQRAAAADALGITPRRFVHILQGGAPPRWTFDLFLTPYSNAGFVSSPQLGNVYDFASKGSSIGYSTVLKAGINVPHMWQYTVAAANGGYRPQDPLLNNLLVLRGIQVGNPDHGAAQSMQSVPGGATQSMSALAADAGSNAIAAVNLNMPGFQFISKDSKSAISVANGGNSLSQLLSPFTPTPAGTLVTNKNKLSASLDSAIGVMNKFSESQVRSAASISTATQSAKDLLSTGFGNLTTTWDALNGKYTSLMMKSMDSTRNLPGINDSKIVPDGTDRYRLGQIRTTDADMRALILPTSYVTNLAAHFAVAEFVLTQNLSSSISIAPGYLNNLQFNGGVIGSATDEHFTGGGISTILNTYMNLAISACLLELIDKLKAANIFNETVIVMGGEFGRSARADGFGSDHGFMGSSSAIYSGAITGPLVLGNIYNSKSQDPSDIGTWGNGASVKELGRPLSPSDWASTIAYLLRVPSPTTAAASLIVDTGAGGYEPVIEKAKQV